MPSLEELRASLRNPVSLDKPAAPKAWAEDFRWINNAKGHYEVSARGETAPISSGAVDKIMVRAERKGELPSLILSRVIERAFRISSYPKGGGKATLNIARAILKHRKMVLLPTAFPSVGAMVRWAVTHADGLMVPHGYRAQVGKSLYYWNKSGKKWEHVDADN